MNLGCTLCLQVCPEQGGVSGPQFWEGLLKDKFVDSVVAHPTMGKGRRERKVVRYSRGGIDAEDAKDDKDYGVEDEESRGDAGSEDEESEGEGSANEGQRKRAGAAGKQQDKKGAAVSGAVGLVSSGVGGGTTGPGAVKAGGWSGAGMRPAVGGGLAGDAAALAIPKLALMQGEGASLQVGHCVFSFS